jgi:hypothetical protein
MSLKYPTTDSELVQIVRGETGYEDTEDELPQADMDVVVGQSKARVELSTGSTQYYSDDGLGFALAAYTKMRAKAAVENVSLASYTIGDEQVSFKDADPETNQQLQQWAEDVRVGLDSTDVDEDTGLKPRNTSGYIGEQTGHRTRHY